MLFTSKNVLFPNFTWKKKFLQKMVGCRKGVGAGVVWRPPAPPVCTALYHVIKASGIELRYRCFKSALKNNLELCFVFLM